VTVDVNLNVRTGPGTNYDRIGSLAAGTTVSIIGRNADSSWWQIPFSNGPEGKAWISAGYGTARHTEGVPVVEVPPTPTPAGPTATPTAPSSPSQPSAFQFEPAGAYPEPENKGLTQFKGQIKDRAGNPVNGFFLYFTCGGYHVMSYPTGPSSLAPDWAPGTYSQYIRSEEFTCDWTIQVVMYQCSEWFDAQCDQFMPLSAPDHIRTEPGSTVIVYDWWCNWDCDKGLVR